MRIQSMLSIGIALACVSAACGTTSWDKKKADAEASEQVDIQFVAFGVSMDTQKVARRIQRQTEDRELRRQMILWQLHTNEVLRRALQRPDARWAFVDILTMLLQARDYVVHGPGKERLGDQLEFAIESLKGMIARIEGNAGRYLKPEQLEALKVASRKWANDHPIEGKNMSDADAVRSKDQGGTLFGAVMAVPEGIFSFGGGVKDTATSVGEVAIAVDRGVEVLNSLPSTIRLETELLMYSIEENESVSELLNDIDRVSDSIVSVANTVEGLPDRVELATIKAIRELDATQPEIQRTLDKGRGVVDEARATIKEIAPILDRVQETGKWVERSSEEATRAGVAWEGAFGQLNLLVHPPEDPDAPPPEPSPPFDFKDVVRTGEHATATAEQLHATVLELRGIIDGEGLGERLEQVDSVTRSVLDNTSVVAGDLVDRIAVRAALLIALFFGLLLGYRLVTLRLTRGT